MTPWIFLRLLFLPALAVMGTILGGWWTFSIPFVCFVLNPLLNLFSNTSNKKNRENVDDHLGFRFIPYLFLFLLLALTTWETIQSSKFSLPEFFGNFISTGIVNSVLGFTIAHEFIHRHNKVDKLAGQMLLWQNSQPYYGIEHIGGHHVYACTPDDPHTARIGESFYRFFPRSAFMTFINAWKIETSRLAKKKIPPFHVQNRMLRFIIIQLLIDLTIYFFAGPPAFVFFVLQGAVAIFILNLTGYLQHYGLFRKQLQDDHFEKIAAHHAWGSGKKNDGFNLFQLDKHADHHMHPSHSYENLVHHDESPAHPTGYAGMMWMALIPPLWFKTMNKRIPSFHQ